MATKNMFALLGDDESEDIQDVVSRVVGPVAAPKPEVKAAAVKPSAPSKVAPAQPARTSTAAVRGRGGDRGARSSTAPHGYSSNTNRDTPLEGGEVVEGRDLDRPSGRGRGGGAGGRGGRGYHHRGNGREFERRTGTGRGHELKRHGAGVANWGVEGELPTAAEGAAEEKEAEAEAEGDVKADEVVVETPKAEDVEEKELTLEEYEVIREEKRKALLALKGEERKVVADKAFETMKKVQRANDDELVLIKLGVEKEKARKEEEEKERRVRAININEFLKPSEGEYVPPRREGGRGGRGGRGGERRGRGAFGGGSRGGYNSGARNEPQINTADTAEFPTLGGK